MITLPELCDGKRVRSRARVWRSATIGIALLMLSGVLSEASATWSSFWTFTPATGTWVWTWVWTSPGASGVSAVARPGGADELISAASDSADVAGPDCCGITISDFGKLKPASIKRTGLLATDFIIEQTYGSNTSDLTLQYIGQTTLDPGTFLGLMTLTDPDALPDSNPPVELAYEEAFRDASGTVLRDIGVINSGVSVPEPGSLLLSLSFLLAVGVWILAGGRAGRGRLGRRSRSPRALCDGRITI